MVVESRAFIGRVGIYSRNERIKGVLVLGILLHLIEHC